MACYFIHVSISHWLIQNNYCSRSFRVRMTQSYLRVIHTGSAGFRLDAWLKEISCSAKQMHSRKRKFLLPTCLFYFLGRCVTDVVPIGSILIQDCDLCWHSFNEFMFSFIFIPKCCNGSGLCYSTIVIVGFLAYNIIDHQSLIPRGRIPLFVVVVSVKYSKMAHYK